MGRGLSPLQRQILTAADASEFVSISTLVEATYHGGCQRRPVVRTTVSRAVSALQDRGLIERVSLQSGRRKIPAIRKVAKAQEQEINT
jgi:hypothetical protein